ncbi:hypothetical protein TNIN_400611 [Trichonephila inaurata madagascariensis]|uniref:Uncharacterized protein n=1 Tax=Trichonephila inaurata madagascariensis TaxID=2747483 RepID=A0A8X7BTI7_9ARAC|nr:hypothetical protein TNIN_400611 [Trichonephila inaurata madagascariensis]
MFIYGGSGKRPNLRGLGRTSIAVRTGVSKYGRVFPRNNQMSRISRFFTSIATTKTSLVVRLYLVVNESKGSLVGDPVSFMHEGITRDPKM